MLVFCATVLLSASPAMPQDPGNGDATPRTTADQRIRAELSEPFCYFLVPSDVLGFKDCPEGTQVTHDGAFNTGFGEFDLYVGIPPTPIAKRVKTLHRGYLPIVEYTVDHEGVRYGVQAFGAPVDLDPRGNLINFIRVTVENPQKTAVEAGLGAAFVDLHGEARHKLSCQAWYRDRFMDASVFGANRSSNLGGGAAWRDGHLVFTHPLDGVQSSPPGDGKEVGGPAVWYRFDLAPGAKRRFDFRLPYVPVDKRRPDQVAAVVKARHDDYLRRTVAFWEGVLGSALRIELPEDKVVHTQRASLFYDLIARDITEDGSRYVQKVNEFQYDHFYPRDSAYFIRAYDLLGLHEIAAETLEHFLTYDDDGRPNGLKRLMPDDWGQSLWSLGAHFRTTGDVDFAKRVYPAVRPHVDAFVAACKKDPLGLWPIAGPYDNEAITGHYTGHSFWALLGLREAVSLAKAVGATADANAFQRIHDEYRGRFMKRLRAVAAKAEGYIPPGIDDPNAGYDWANASGGVYPFGVLGPHDPLVTATVRTVREYKYREGIMTYGPNAWVVKQKMRLNRRADPGWLHHYETFYVTETLLARGEQRKVIEDFYSILAHTGSTHSGFEFSIRPWDNRDPGGNRPPHGWFAARYNTLLRNMLVREQGDDLHLASALSPVWVRAGERIRITEAATFFGRVSYTMDVRDDGADVAITAKWRTPPRRMLLHVPWFVEVDTVRVDGKPASVDSGAVVLRPQARRVSYTWRPKERPDLSYPTAVRHYLEKYHRRPTNADYSFLFPTPRPPRLTGQHGVFVESMTVGLMAPGGIGDIHYTVDGPDPDKNAPRYADPFDIDKTTTIKAITVWDDGRVSEPMQVTLTKVQPRRADHPAETSPGLLYDYHEGAWGALPDFDKLKPARRGTAEAFNLTEVGHRGDNFGVRFTGYIDVPRDGIYSFFSASDDGSRLLIGSTLVVDNDGLHRMQEVAGEIALKRGRHAIAVTFFERGGAERLGVSYAGPGIDKRTIPPSVLSRTADGEN